MSYIDDIKQEEGFNGVVYKCTEGFDTIGYGTKLPLTKEEATLLLEYRLNKMKSELNSSLYALEAPDEVWSILYNMAYQLGVPGVLKFSKFIKALQNKNYSQASIEMLDSKWAKQTPNRAKRLSDRMKAIK